MAEFTFLKVTLDGSSFTANTSSGREPSAGASSDGANGGETDGDDGDDVQTESGSDGTAGFVAAALGLLFLVVVAVVVRRYLTEDGPETTDEAVVSVE